MRGILSGNGRFKPYGHRSSAPRPPSGWSPAPGWPSSASTPSGPTAFPRAAPIAATLIGAGRQRNLVTPGPDAPWSELSTALGYLLAGSVMAQLLVNAGVFAVQILADAEEKGPGGVAGRFLNGLIIARIPLFMFQAVQAVAAAQAGPPGRRRPPRRLPHRAEAAAGRGGGHRRCWPRSPPSPSARSWSRPLFGEEFRLTHTDLGYLAGASAVYMLALALAQALIALANYSPRRPRLGRRARRLRGRHRHSARPAAPGRAGLPGRLHRRRHRDGRVGLRPPEPGGGRDPRRRRARRGRPPAPHRAVSERRIEAAVRRVPQSWTDGPMRCEKTPRSPPISPRSWSRWRRPRSPAPLPPRRPSSSGAAGSSRCPAACSGPPGPGSGSRTSSSSPPPAPPACSLTPDTSCPSSAPSPPGASSPRHLLPQRRHGRRRRPAPPPQAAAGRGAGCRPARHRPSLSASACWPSAPASPPPGAPPA